MGLRDGRARPWMKLVAVLGLLAALGGCASDRGSAPSSARDERAAGGAAPEEAETAPATPPTENEKVGGAPRSQVYVGSISVRVDDVTKAADKAGGIATTGGGFVAGDNRRAATTGDRRQGYAELVLRVPSAKFTETVDALAKLGEELERERKVDDVTEAVLDLDNRIASKQASVNRIRQLMARAEDMNQIVTLERELSQREADLASLLARKRDLGDKVAYSTISVNLYGPRTEYTPKKAEVGFVAGVKAGWKAFTSLVVMALTILGAMLPFLALLAIVVVPLVWYLRRRSRRRLPPAPGGGPTPSPAGPPPPTPVLTGKSPQS